MLTCGCPVCYDIVFFFKLRQLLVQCCYIAPAGSFAYTWWLLVLEPQSVNGHVLS